jgi:hypothetical protein
MRTAIAAAILVSLALPALAHHSFSAEFDSTKQVTLDGQVVMMEWVNPHSWLHIDVKKADGTTERWKVEGGSPSVLMRLGWNRNSLPRGHASNRRRISGQGRVAQGQLARPEISRRAAPESGWIGNGHERTQVGRGVSRA